MPVEVKFCSGCKKDLPLKEFSADRSRKDNLSPLCRECDGKRVQRYQLKNRVKHLLKKIVGKKDQFCPGCRETLPANKFYQDRTTKSGLSTYCQDCSRRRQKEYYKKSQKRALERVLEYERQTGYADCKDYGEPGYIFGSEGIVPDPKEEKI